MTDKSFIAVILILLFGLMTIIAIQNDFGKNMNMGENPQKASSEKTTEQFATNQQG